MTNLCVRCGRPTPDGYCCSSCAYRAGDQLHETADMAPAARDIAHRTSRRGGGGGSGKPGSSLPLDLGATQRLDAVEAEYATWVRVVVEERGIDAPVVRRGEEPIAVYAIWLSGHIEWIRHKPYADEFLTAVEACMRLVRGLARGPAEQKYLGRCGAPVEALDVDAEGGPVVYETGTCEGDVYASRGSRTGRCRVCGAEVSAGDREAWLDAQARSHAFTAADIADAYRINVKTIRTWANRGALRSYFVTEAGIVAEWTEPAEGEERGPRVHYVGDVLDLAAADAARRATEQAKRARRAAAKAAETEDAA